MVNFNSDFISQKPPIDVVNLLIIEDWFNLKISFENYINQSLKKQTIPISESRSRLASLFLSCYNMLSRHLPEEKFNTIKIICLDINTVYEYIDVVDCYIEIATVLDKVGITKLDNKKIIDRSRVEEENKSVG